MARLYDRLKRVGAFARGSFFYLPGRDATIIETTNIYKYGCKHDIQDTTGFCITPPFTYCFLEFYAKEVDTHYGTLLITYDRRLNKKVSKTLFLSRDLDDDTRWSCVAFFFVGIQKMLAQLPVIHEFNLDCDGTVIDTPEFGQLRQSITIKLLCPYNERDQNLVEACEVVADVNRNSLALMNTKNVELIDHPPPIKLSKKHEKKYGQPLVAYKTAQVSPMRTVQRMDGDDAPSSERDTISKGIQPLHIVAGNFADYRDGPGMFGNPKLKGVYWRPQHVRGNVERGVVVKDYEVKAPESDES